MASKKRNDVVEVDKEEEREFPAVNLHADRPVLPMKNISQDGSRRKATAREGHALRWQFLLILLTGFVIIALLFNNYSVVEKLHPDANPSMFGIVREALWQMLSCFENLVIQAICLYHDVFWPNSPNPPEVPRPGNITKHEDAVEKARNVIAKVMFREYKEHSNCDVSKGIPLNKFNSSVATIANLLMLPPALTASIIDAGNFEEGQANAVTLLSFKGWDGYLYFGKFVVIKTSPTTIGLSYALHGVKFILGPQSVQPAGTEDFVKFAQVVANGENITEAFLNKNGVDHFNKYFLHLANEEFEKRCGQLAKEISSSYEAIQEVDHLDLNDSKSDP